MINMLDFAERLEELMFERELNMQTLAKTAGVSRATVNRYLLGQLLPSVGAAMKLADHFNCSVDYLLGRTDDTPESFLSCPPFSERLRFLLEQYRCTQYRLCVYGKFAPSTVRNWLLGIHVPSMDNVLKLADFFDCSADYVLGREK